MATQSLPQNHPARNGQTLHRTRNLTISTINFGLLRIRLFNETEWIKPQDFAPMRLFFGASELTDFADLPFWALEKN